MYFPWPRLRFDEEAGRLQACGEIGFEITDVRRDATRLDDFIDFYLRVEDKLGRYPAYDLETDFLMLVLRKAPGPFDRFPQLGYLERQRRLDALVDSRRARRPRAAKR